jgi:hypothetical protein
MTEQFFGEQVGQVKEGVISQPDASTCQSACIAMALGRKDVMAIRAALIQKGPAGDPANMMDYLAFYLGPKYEFDDNASMSEIQAWLKAGEFLITHGWFTNSGHVIGLDGVSIDPATLSYKISVKDPWDEFNAAMWSYSKKLDRYDGFYSSRLIYATCVAGQSFSDALRIYQRGELDSARKGAWIHRIKP